MRNTRNVVLTVLLFGVTVGAWEAAVRVLEVPAFILPPPSRVVVALWRGFATGRKLYGPRTDPVVVRGGQLQGVWPGRCLPALWFRIVLATQAGSGCICSTELIVAKVPVSSF